MANSIKMKVKQFILLEECPDEWKKFDLYIIRDENLVFYVGQSYLAFHRVWDHIKNGYKWRSDVGRFILCNWPKSMNYEIELLSSGSPEFAIVNNNLLKAEEMLIRMHKPCFNVSQNVEPSPLPVIYLPPGSTIRCSRSLTRLRYQAEQSIRNDERKKWMEEW
ncbi:MAG TPA: hypothetical protein VFQ13_06630 [Anaerolineales bacterium]|nr:hypothetical protein [Anaerolineales bacterium]